VTVPHPSELNAKQQIWDNAVAVLPFINLSNDSNLESFSDGLTNEITNALSKVRGLRVKSRSSASVFKNKVLPIRQISRELNVSAIVEGTVRQSNGRVRITAQLIKADGDFYCWSETWDRTIDDVFKVQEEISLRIAKKISENGLRPLKKDVTHFSFATYVLKTFNVFLRNVSQVVDQNRQIRSLEAQ